MIHTGPPVHLQQNGDEFKEKWENNPRTVTKPFKKQNRWYVEVKREYTQLRHLINEQLPQLSLGKHIDQISPKKITILEKDDLMSENLRLFWTTYLDQRKPWEW